jgi:hypothetical protein
MEAAQKAKAEKQEEDWDHAVKTTRALNPGAKAVDAVAEDLVKEKAKAVGAVEARDRVVGAVKVRLKPPDNIIFKHNLPVRWGVKGLQPIASDTRLPCKKI